jgi:C1A family cysteine protease
LNAIALNNFIHNSFTPKKRLIEINTCMSNPLCQKARKIKRYGWKRSLPDHRDIKFIPSPCMLKALPAMVDLRSQCPAVYDQGDLGSCTANAIGGLVEFLEMKEGHPAFVPSRLFIYYNERVLEGTVSQDAGAEIRDGMKVVNTLGAPHEALWWYNTVKFAVKPNKGVYADGIKHKVTSYQSVDNTNLQAMQAVLAAGYPVVGGFTVYDSFESDAVARTGIVPMPAKTEQVLGGHAILVVGYDNSKNWFIVRNSWGAGWGAAGYFYMPYAYFTNADMADDFWTANMAM